MLRWRCAVLEYDETVDEAGQTSRSSEREVPGFCRVPRVNRSSAVVDHQRLAWIVRFERNATVSSMVSEVGIRRFQVKLGPIFDGAGDGCPKVVNLLIVQITL